VRRLHRGLATRETGGEWERCPPGKAQAEIAEMHQVPPAKVSGRLTEQTLFERCPERNDRIVVQFAALYVRRAAAVNIPRDRLALR